MNSLIIQPWILIGYELFSKEGPAGLKVEVMARKVGKSKSSFYHHFADIEVFTEVLLNHHLERSKIIAIRERMCKKMIPDMLNLLVEVKQDLLFNRQLRVNRHIPAYKKCFESANGEVEDAFLEIWSETLGLSENSNAARKVLEQSIENFYLQITDETLTYEWLLKFVSEIRFMVREISYH
jgi:AcrR family transcriptional regulator